MKKIRTSLVGRLTGRFLLLMIIIVLVVSCGVFYLEEQATRQFYSEIYHNKMRITNEYTRRVISDVYVAVTNNLYYLEHSLDNPDGHKATMERIVNSGTRIRSCGVSFIDSYYPQKGRLYCPYAWRDVDNPDTIFAQDMCNEESDYLNASWFLNVVNSDTAQWSEPFYDHFNQRTTLSAYMVPIHDKTGRVVAVLGADISLNWFTNKLNEADTVINSIKMFMASSFEVKSNSFIINRDGRYVTNPDKKRIMRDNFFLQVQACDGSNVEGVINRILNGKEDNKTPERFIVDGKECYLYYMPVKYTQWILVTAVPCKTIDTLCYLNGVTVLLIILIPLLLLAIVSYWYMRKALKPVKQLAKVADDIVDGKLDTHLPTTKYNDEISQLRHAMEEIQGILSHYTNDTLHTPDNGGKD